VVSDSKFAPADRLRVLEQRASPEEALAFFDGCGPVGMEEMLGCWKGSGVPTGHPFDGLLEALGWHGKRFQSPDEIRWCSRAPRACSARTRRWCR